MGIRLGHHLGCMIMVLTVSSAHQKGQQALRPASVRAEQHLPGLSSSWHFLLWSASSGPFVTSPGLQERDRVERVNPMLSFFSFAER